jgi:hypothetical protein
MGTPVTGSSGPCTGATDLVCTGALAQDFNLSAQWAWNVVAAGPGSYSIAATVSSSDSDPAPSNNSTTFAFRSPRPAVEAEAEVEVGVVVAARPLPRAGSRSHRRIRRPARP